MKGKLKSWIIAIVIILILMIPIIINYISNKRVEVISYDEYSTLVSSSDFAVVYYGDVSKDSYSKVKDNLTAMKGEFDSTIKAVDITKLSAAERKELIASSDAFGKNSEYVFIKDKAVVKVTNDELTRSELEEEINYYLNNIIPDSKVAYKTVSTYSDYLKIINGKTTTMSVFGRNTCQWCNKFKPIYNEVASENKVDIYFFDSDSYNKDEYSKIMNSDVLYIPAACNENKKDEPLSNGFGTPLTLFTKKGKVVGCLSGYVNKNSLVEKLKNVGMIK